VRPTRGRARSPAPRRAEAARRRSGERGFTLVEILVALLIVATTIATLQVVSSATLRGAVETNRIRIAKMLLRQKAEEIAAGVEQGAGGSFEGFPGYEWEASEQETPVTPESAGTQGGQPVMPESVRTVTVLVRYPTAEGGDPADVPENEDGPGQVRVTTLLDPLNAELKPPPQ
jgi:prepilin-type N-terminal cleavage/methylation domain-containing protein